MIWVSPLDGNLTWYLHLKLPISTMFSFPVFIFQPHLSLDSGIGPEPGNKTKGQPMMASSAPKTAPTTPLGGGLHGYRKPHLSRAQSGGLSNGNGNGVPMPHATSVGLRRTQRYVQTFTILNIYLGSYIWIYLGIIHLAKVFQMPAKIGFSASVL